MQHFQRKMLRTEVQLRTREASFLVRDYDEGQGGAICFVIDHICNTDLTELEETQALPKNSCSKSKNTVPTPKITPNDSNDLQFPNGYTCLSQNVFHLSGQPTPKDELFQGKEARLLLRFHFVSITPGQLQSIKEKGTQCQHQARNAHNPLLKAQKYFSLSINNKTSLLYSKGL